MSAKRLLLCFLGNVFSCKSKFSLVYLRWNYISFLSVNFAAVHPFSFFLIHLLPLVILSILKLHKAFGRCTLDTNNELARLKKLNAFMSNRSLVHLNIYCHFLITFFQKKIFIAFSSTCLFYLPFFLLVNKLRHTILLVYFPSESLNYPL